MTRLKDIAHGRSGDKGNHANIGVIAYTPEGDAWLERELTGEKVRSYFAGLGTGAVERFPARHRTPSTSCCGTCWAAAPPIPCGPTRQGKVLATALLEMELPENPGRPGEIKAMLPPGGKTSMKPARLGGAKVDAHTDEKYRENVVHNVCPARPSCASACVSPKAGGGGMPWRSTWSAASCWRGNDIALLDPESDFLELSPLAAWDMYEGRLPRPGS